MRRLRYLLVAGALETAAGCDSDGDSGGSSPFGDSAGSSSTTSEKPATGVKVFDEDALEGDDGVKKILVEDYQLTDVEAVDCPANQKVKTGSEFDCLVSVDGKELKAKITVTSDDGEYQVGLPE